MAIFRVLHNSNYSVINNTNVKDQRLSWKAKGLFTYAFSRPNDWEFNTTDLVNQSIDGRDSVNAGLSELEAAGYLVRVQSRQSGKWGKAEWLFFETPRKFDDEIAEKPYTEKPYTEKPYTENPEQLSTDILNTDVKLSTEKKQQHNAAVSFMHEELEKIDIPDKDKIEITKRYDGDTVKNAIAWALHPQTKITKGLAPAIKWACANRPQIPVSNEDEIENNRSYAKKHDGLRNENFKVEALYKCIEVLSSGGTKIYEVIDYKEKGFIDKLKKTLIKCDFEPFPDD